MSLMISGTEGCLFLFLNPGMLIMYDAVITLVSLDTEGNRRLFFLRIPITLPIVAASPNAAFPWVLRFTNPAQIMKL